MIQSAYFDPDHPYDHSLSELHPDGGILHPYPHPEPYPTPAYGPLHNQHNEGYDAAQPVDYDPARYNAPVELVLERIEPPSPPLLSGSTEGYSSTDGGRSSGGAAGDPMEGDEDDPEEEDDEMADTNSGDEEEDPSEEEELSAMMDAVSIETSGGFHYEVSQGGSEIYIDTCESHA
ncbi:hypothetical protein PIB30_040663 [Stylosanthes scabra]|uniref:Uncharacterized protein n=1 Tax=Stylosanthes scabra TaxID=79078 RepID=A0ABU6YDI7_9FABA|nr:hypothetical protein [Stylosanthes scabra]